MQRFPASVGWDWIKEGYALFRRQPAEMCTLFLAYLFLMLAIGILPLLGQVLPLLLIPPFSMAFMEACLRIERGQRVYPTLLFSVFRSPRIKPLIGLGLCYLGAALLAIGLAALVDGGALWKAMSGQLGPDTDAVVEGGDLLPAMLVAALVYTPAAMAFWYAAPLVAWNRMSVGKAMFYSFFAVRREGRAFLVYALGWALLGIVVPAVVGALASILLGRTMATMLILLPLSVVLTVVMYCSFYPTYTRVFGEPEQPAEEGPASAG